ncbi:phospho-N-acetylmuramoyl-pentapeptide-transferase [Mycetocola tolaasinivorans]|uniref:Phospho-N-acetylmuramoyl-pentapeptide-transferase n=1 Tax=Mycetocola tolaasinivorans TaxID=76635 RepID=A0A3L7ACH6_9MICO|nr:phospho-N-acetylmuramoyl-pentapeptide-transferase [Mycetocola tolaasinivorans]RLP78063.1 phospho-N-acetylmuramoyl-pentapeptide-transferase [Mycetocola tolaasinivorans]
MLALLLAVVLSTVFSLALTPVFVKLFHKLQWGQFIRSDGPQSHHSKRGTATMGGIVIILGTLFGYFVAKLISGDSVTVSGMLVLFMMVGLGLVGFTDDFLKVRKQQSLGLGGWSKIAGQLVVAVAFGIMAINFANSNGLTPASTAISFTRDLNFDLIFAGPFVGYALYLIWTSFLVVGTSNGVNLTDGLDGLATGATILALGSYVIIGFWQFNQSCFNPALTQEVAHKCYSVRDPLDLAIVAAAIAGALIGFLWWNTSPADIFLGDTGSLALGGAVVALAILTHTELLLILIGGLYVIEAGSVIIQRAYFKITHGKRIFLMSPIHHHFELKGWAEVTVVVRFWIIAGLLCAAGVGLFYLEWFYR